MNILIEGELSVCEEDGCFCISVTKESDLSLDGGYTFEYVTNDIELTHSQAYALYKELMKFVAKGG